MTHRQEITRRLVVLALLPMAVGLTGCSGMPKNAPGCSGQWQSLNPAHYQMKQEQGADNANG